MSRYISISERSTWLAEGVALYAKVMDGQRGHEHAWNEFQRLHPELVELAKRFQAQMFEAIMKEF